MSAYAGIGSRETPADVIELMIAAGYYLGETHNLRSGDAAGADTAFFQGALESGGEIELYLPWPSFNGRDYKDARDQAVVELWEPQRGADRIAERFHPRWASLKQGARKLHSRNVHQILGPNINSPDPSAFVMCWTVDGAGGGGTGQALRIAKHFGVPIFDLALADVRARVEKWLENPRKEEVA